MEKTGVNGCFEKIAAIRYDHREGGRYAYVQLMAALRELREALAEAGQTDPLLHAELEHSAELLNSLVALRFEESHRLVFEDRMSFISEVQKRAVLDLMQT